MAWLAWLCLLHYALVVGCEALAPQFCKRTEGCSKMWDLKVPRGKSQSLILPLDATKQKMVLKCDPETGEWEEQLLAHSESSYVLSNDEKGISLVNQSFTVRNADKIHEGLYKITLFLSDDGTCFALVNVTVLDYPLFVTAVPSAITFLSGTSQASPPGTSQASPPGTSQASPPGTSQASPPGTSQASPGSNTIIIPVIVVVCLFVAFVILTAVVLVPKYIKRKSNQSSWPASPVENGLHMDGLLPQQQGNQQGMDGLLPSQQQRTTMV